MNVSFGVLELSWLAQGRAARNAAALRPLAWIDFV